MSEAPEAQEKKDEFSGKCVYFSGSVFLCIFQAGVALYLQDNYKEVLRKVKVLGTSAGSFIATHLVLETDFDEVRKRLIACCQDFRKSKLGLFDASRCAKFLLQDTIPSDVAEKLKGERLGISVTKLGPETTWVPRCELRTKFETKEDLTTTLLQSSHIPLVSEGVHKQDTSFLLDGAFSFLPERSIKDSRSVLTVSCLPIGKKAETSSGESKELPNEFLIYPEEGSFTAMERFKVPSSDERVESIFWYGFTRAEQQDEEDQVVKLWST